MLRDRFRCILRNEQMVAYNLRDAGEDGGVND
jgi:hypothetical protein